MRIVRNNGSPEYPKSMARIMRISERMGSILLKVAWRIDWCDTLSIHQQAAWSRCQPSNHSDEEAYANEYHVQMSTSPASLYKSLFYS